MTRSAAVIDDFMALIQNWGVWKISGIIGGGCVILTSKHPRSILCFWIPSDRLREVGTQLPISSHYIQIPCMFHVKPA